MKYSDEVIEDIRLDNDIVDIINGYTTLRQKGNSFFGLCPFHKESTPSFSVSSEKQLYHCFGCGASGTVINFIMNIENYSFLEAIQYLADRVNYQLPELTYSTSSDSGEIELKKKLYDINKIVAKKYYENLSIPEGNIANKYLDERKILPHIRKKYGLGYSLQKNDDIYKLLKTNGYTESEILESGLVLKGKNGELYNRFFGRLMFPIIDIKGRIVGFGGRDLLDKKNTAKYLNSPDSIIFNKSFNLYSMNFARNTRSKELILVEGYIDVISLYQIGVTNVVASLGTAFNENHAKVLKKNASKVIILFDNDEAGIKATLRAIPILTKNGIQVKVLQVSNAKDPDEYIKKFGADSFIKLLSSAKSYVSFQIEQKLKEYNINKTTEKIEFTKEVAKIISKLGNEIEKEVFTKETSALTGISFNAIFNEIKNFSETSSINFSKIKYNKPKKNFGYNKEKNAREGLLYILASNINVYNTLKSLIKSEEFLDDTYIQLSKIIFEYHNNGKNIYPAEITNKFDDLDTQQKISKVFMQKFDISKSDTLERAVNDYYKIIKKEYIEFNIQNATNSSNLEDLQRFLKEKKQLDKIYIKL